MIVVNVGQESDRNRHGIKEKHEPASAWNWHRGSWTVKCSCDWWVHSRYEEEVMEAFIEHLYEVADIFYIFYGLTSGAW